MATNGIDKVQSSNLTEVKGYKKANSGLLKKVLLGLGGILLAVSLMCNLRCCTANLDCNDEEDLDNDTKIETTVSGSYSQGTTKPSTSTSNQGTNSNQNQNTNNNTNNNNNNNNNSNNNNNNNSGTSTTEKVEDSWVTDTIPDDEKITFEDYEKAEKKEDSLTKAEKEYIQEYVDYYGISWEDAMVTYFAYGPLDLSFCNDNSQNEEVEYGTRYVFDADDLASINALVTELGMSKTEAEDYYVTVIAPSLGKPIATESYVLTK